MINSASNLWTSRRVTQGAILAAYVLLSIWATWPLALRSTICLPMGNLSAGTVPLFNLWTIWWNADRLPHVFQDYWNAPIFHPVPDTFAFSEPQPTTILVAPILWLTGSRVLTYNVYLWLSLLLNAVFAERLLRVVGVNKWLAPTGGAAMLLLPAIHWQLDVVQLVPVWGILWTWTACLQAGQTPSVRRGAEVGLAYAVTFLTCGHQGLFLAVLLMGTVWALLRNWRSRTTWLSAFAAIVVASILVAPVAFELRHALARQEFQRNPEIVAQLSGLPGDYLAHTGTALIDPPLPGTRLYWGFSPGWLKVVLALFGATFGLTRRRWRRWTLFLLLTGILAFLLSLGPNLQIRNWQPWWTLTSLVPGFAHVRNVFRFAFFVQIVSVVLAVQGLNAGWLLIRHLCRNRSWRCILQSAVVILALVSAFEIRPMPLAFVQAPNETANAGWIGYIREQTPRGQGIVCFPFATGDHVNDFDITTRWMYYGTFHGVPLVNGYSGFFPREYFELQDAANAGTLSAAFLEKLVQAKVEFLVVNRNLISADKMRTTDGGQYQLRRVFQDPVGVDVYRVHRASSPQ